jgi:16S rRNA (guanine(966)-N(2))-methyltransferase RsmD
MRIITGTAKGRQIKIPRDADFRPTSDKTRETLFNVISRRVVGSIFVDCFSGSGAVALEAISRGAEKAIAIENNRLNCQLITENGRKLGFENKLELIEDDYIPALMRLDRNGISPDVLFFDPPYFADIYGCLLDFLAQARSINKGLIIIEHFKKTVIQSEPLFNLYKVSKCGDTHLSYLIKKSSP